MEQQRGLCSFNPGCSTCSGAGVSTGTPTMRLSITSTTGSPVELSVPRGETVEGLRTHISQRLRLHADRIVILYRDRQLTTGKLLDLGLTDGSKLTLVPVIEAGLVCSTARAERSMMDVLESLTEVQVSDFLSGRSPLTINLGIGAHMMYVQLQLSAQNVADLQHCSNFKVGSSRQHQTSLPAVVRTGLPGSAQTPAITGSSTLFAPQKPSTPLGTSNSTSSILFSTQRPGTSLNSTASTSHTCTAFPAVTCHHHSPQCPVPHSTHTCPNVSMASLLSECPHPGSLAQGATLVCSPALAGSVPGPQTPAAASIFKEKTSATTELCKQPGAVIDSLVSHSPGIFSGTFSGTLAPCSQSSISHPRSGIAIILQILNDLLRAACHHQGAPPSLPHLHSQASNHQVGPLLTAEELTEAKQAKTSKTVTQRAEHFGKTLGEESHTPHSSTQENQALHCKLERLQFLMHQRRLHRRTRRTSNLSQPSHPYQQHHRHR